ncbi:MAG: tetratricopeptide repeat-containing sensor histidine kinase [Prolixibacteraceae bacterium]
MKNIILTLFVILLTFTARSQSKVDSLLLLCEKVNDIEKTSIYLTLSKLTVQDSALSNWYNRKAYQLAAKNNLLSEKAKSVYQTGKIFFTSRDFTTAIRYYEKAIPLFRQLNDTSSLTTCYSYIGISNFNLSKSKDAIASYLEGLKLSKNDPDYSAELLANIGLVHTEMNNFKEAVSYFRQALKINQSIRDTGSLAIDYDHLGVCYSEFKMPDSALVNHHKALYFFKKIGKEDRYAVSLSNIAWVLPNYPDSLNKAITYFNMAWTKFQELGWNHYEADTQHGIAYILSKQGKLDASVSTYKNSIRLAKKYHRELFLMKKIHLGLSEVYKLKGDYQNALESHILYSQYSDSAVEKQKFDQLAALEKQFDTEKKENEIIRLQSKQEITDIQLKKNKQLKQLGYVTTLMLLGFVFFVLLKYFDKIKLNKILEEKNQIIEASERELKIINAAKNKFFSIIAHDLKNPLHSVLGYSSLLSKDYERFSDHERRKFANDINVSTNNIFRLLQNLLEWSRSQTGKITFEPLEVELKKLLDNSVNVLYSVAEQKNIRINFDYNEELKIYADPLMIETILRNLINNAIKFTPENGEIAIVAKQNENTIEICVTDTGTGISETDRQNLFRIDSKVKRKGTNNEDGSGLGLILCKEFVEKNNGTIWVESSPGIGSTFHFTVPVKAIA